MTRHERRAMWRTHVDQQRTCGKSAASYCRTHDLCLPSFYAWRKRLSGDGPGPGAFVEVLCHDRLPDVITLTRCPDGQWQLQLSGTIDAAALGTLVQTLEAALSKPPCSQS